MTTMIDTKNIRQVAVKLTISDILEGDYIQENEQNPNYLLLKSGAGVYRINVIVVVLRKEQIGTITNLLIEDNTGAIIARFFEESKVISQVQAGDVILLIGKVRMYNQEKYISPEIVKKTSLLWLKQRRLELPRDKNIVGVGQQYREMNQEGKNNEVVKENIGVNNLVVEEIIEENVMPVQKLMSLIKNLDTGEGAGIEELIEKSPLEQTEELLERMMKNGDVFQNMPGRVKVL